MFFLLSSETKFLEYAFDILNHVYFNSELPKVVITIQSSPKTYGHITTQKIWNGLENNYYEINLSAENLNRPPENVLATLVHEMVHLYCMENNIADTSKNGRYHNKHFKEQAEKRDLHIEYRQYIGYSHTEPTDLFIATLEKHNLMHNISFERGGFTFQPPTGGNDNGGVNGKPKSSTRKYKCPNCGISVRATKTVELICKNCMQDMICLTKY